MAVSAGRLRHSLRRAALAVAALVLVAAPVFLSRAGAILVETDPLFKADVLFVLSGTRAERFLAAVDLYKAGYAPTILISPGRTENAERILRGKGVWFPSDAELARNAILQLGVPPSAVLAPDGWTDNTAQEAALLRQIASVRSWHSAIVVTSKYHSRRSGFAFRREFRDSSLRIAIAPSLYDDSDPEHWWRHRADVRFVMTELPKLLAYRLGLGG